MNKSYVKTYDKNMRHSGVMDMSAALDKKADIEYVNELIQAATATFRGTYNVVTDLSLAYNATHSQIEDALETKMAALSIVPDNNDYSFVQIPTSDEAQTEVAKVEKYTYNGSEWAYEYELNNSGFTDAQWSAINSGATLELIGKLSALPTNAELTTLLNAKVSYDDNGAYDVSAHNSGATFASLSALLSNENIDTLIPAAVRKGGMSIKFVHTYDNKYIQARCIAGEFTTDTEDWVIAEEGVYVENPEFVYVKTDKDGKILWAIKTDGSIYYGAGVPQQVIDYISEKLAELSLDEYEDIVAFLSDYLGSDTTLKVMIDRINGQIAIKVDKIEGKSLIDAEYADGVSQTENPEFAEVHTDADDKILYGVKQDGDFYFGAEIPSQIQEELDNKVGFADFDAFVESKVDKEEGKSLIDGEVAESQSTIEDSEGRTEITTDTEGKIISYRDNDGVLHENVGIETDYIKVNNIIGVNNIDVIEKESDDILYVEKPDFAEMWFVGNLPTDTSDERTPTTLELTFKINKKTVFKSGCTLAIQGQGTSMFPKHNFTFEPLRANGKALSIKFGDMIATDSFHLKGFFTDDTKAVELGGYRWYGDMMSLLDYPYSKVNNMSEDLITTYNKDIVNIADAKYYPDGFPVVFYINEIFHGIYILKLKKTRQNYAMEKSHKEQIFLDAKIDNDHPAPLERQFDYTCWDLKNPKIKGYEEGQEITDATVMANINRLFNYTTDLANQHSNYADYIVLPHWIAFLIFEEIICNADCVSGNYNLLTWDGTHWSILPWDIDRSFKFADPHIVTTEITGYSTWLTFWPSFITYYETEIKAQYSKLRHSGFLTVNNLLKYYKGAINHIPREYFEMDKDKWGTYVTNCYMGIETIATILKNKITWLDTRWLLPDTTVKYSGTLTSGNVPEFDGANGVVKDSGIASSDININN